MLTPPRHRRPIIVQAGHTQTLAAHDHGFDVDWCPACDPWGYAREAARHRNDRDTLAQLQAVTYLRDQLAGADR